MKKAAEKELAEFYPQDTDGARPIAYLGRGRSDAKPPTAEPKFR